MTWPNEHLGLFMTLEERGASNSIVIWGLGSMGESETSHFVMILFTDIL